MQSRSLSIILIASAVLLGMSYAIAVGKAPLAIRTAATGCTLTTTWREPATRTSTRSLRRMFRNLPSPVRTRFLTKSHRKQLQSCLRGSCI
jgi:hypothetical protein